MKELSAEHLRIYGVSQELPSIVIHKDDLSDSSHRYIYCVSWQPPKFWKKHLSKIPRCQKVHENIVKKIMHILNHGVFDFDYVDIGLSDRGVYVEVPGVNGCCVFPSDSIGDSYSNHNIDSARQCVGLCFFLSLVVSELYNLMAFWEDDPNYLITEPDEKRVSFRITRDPKCAPFELYDAKDYEFQPLAVISARNLDEARKLCEQGGLDDCIDIIHSRSPMDKSILSPLRVWKAIVELEGCDPATTEVLASTQSQAERLINEYFDTNPPLFAIISITVSEESSVPLPRVLFKTS